MDAAGTSLIGAAAFATYAHVNGISRAPHGAVSIVVRDQGSAIIHAYDGPYILILGRYAGPHGKAILNSTQIVASDTAIFFCIYTICAKRCRTGAVLKEPRVSSRDAPMHVASGQGMN